MDTQPENTVAATSPSSLTLEEKALLDYQLQLKLVKQDNDRRQRIETLIEAHIKPIGPVADSPAGTTAGAGPAYLQNIFLDLLYEGDCVEKWLQSDPKLYEDLRKVVHLKVPDIKHSICFCGYYSSKADDLDAHLAANPTDKEAVEILLHRLPATNMCEECQQIMRRALYGDFTNTFYDGTESLLEMQGVYD